MVEAKLNPLDVVNVVARNIVPVAGVIFFGWSAANVLLLYFIYTLLVMAVMIAGLASYFAPGGSEGIADWLNAEVGYVAAGLFVAAFLAIPLGVPLYIVFAMNHLPLSDTLADHGFRVGLLVQAIAAAGSYLELYRALKTHTPDEIRLGRRFALVFMRWLVILMAIYLPVIYWFGRFGPLLLVAVYAVTTIVIELAPDRFLRAMPGGDPTNSNGALLLDAGAARAQAPVRHRLQRNAKSHKRG